MLKLSTKAHKSLKSLGIMTLYLFGSRALGTNRPQSDYDFALLLKKPEVLKKGSQALYQKVFDILSESIPLMPHIDIVFLNTVPHQLRYHVIRQGKVLMDEDPLTRLRFEERTLEEHADFEPYRRLFEQTTLAQIS